MTGRRKEVGYKTGKEFIKELVKNKGIREAKRQAKFYIATYGGTDDPEERRFIDEMEDYLEKL